MVSSPCVQIAVHRPSRAMSPRMTGYDRGGDNELSVGYGDKRMEGCGRTVHEDGLCDVVRVVAGHNMIHAEGSSAAIEGLPAEDAAECAVILLSDRGDDAVH